MKAKDTVLTPDQLRNRIDKDIQVGTMAQKALELQDEISFKAGEGAGMKKVVAWIRTMPLFIIRVDRNLNDVVRSLEGNTEWQAKLKEWGIE